MSRPDHQSVNIGSYKTLKVKSIKMADEEQSSQQTRNKDIRGKQLTRSIHSQTEASKCKNLPTGFIHDVLGHAFANAYFFHELLGQLLKDV